MTMPFDLKKLSVTKFNILNQDQFRTQYRDSQHSVNHFSLSRYSFLKVVTFSPGIVLVLSTRCYLLELS